MELQRLMSRKYLPDQCLLKVYGSGDEKRIKLVWMRSLRIAGVEDPDELPPDRRDGGDGKLRESIVRARSRIFELAFCNPWEYFFTGTLDPQKYDRTNLDKFHKDLTHWFRNLRRSFPEPVRFLLIPELHADGCSWHMHGFLSGVPQYALSQFRLGDTMGKSLAEKVKAGHVFYNWPAYQKKFGFCDLEPIRNREAVSNYVLKYVSKYLASGVTSVNSHLFYHSRGLQSADLIKKGPMSVLPDMKPLYEGDFCSVYWLDYSDRLLEYFSSSF